MELYPDDYVEHNLPLVILSGLGGEPDTFEETSERSRSLLLEGGFRIKAGAAPVTGSTANELLQAFLSRDSSNVSWNSRATSASDNVGNFRIKRVGRVGQAPSGAAVAAFQCTTGCGRLHAPFADQRHSPMLCHPGKHHLLHTRPESLRATVEVHRLPSSSIRLFLR